MPNPYLFNHSFHNALVLRHYLERAKGAGNKLIGLVSKLSVNKVILVMTKLRH